MRVKRLTRISREVHVPHRAAVRLRILDPRCGRSDLGPLDVLEGALVVQVGEVNIGRSWVNCVLCTTRVRKSSNRRYSGDAQREGRPTRSEPLR